MVIAVMDNLQTLGTIDNKEGLLSGDALLRCISGGPGLVTVVRATDLKILYVNDQFENHLGYSNADLEGKGLCFDDLLGNYLHDRLRFQLTIAKNDPMASSRYFMYPLKGKNGVEAPYCLYVSPVYTGGVIEAYSLVMHPELSRWDLPFTSFNTRELFLEQDRKASCRERVSSPV